MCSMDLWFALEVIQASHLIVALHLVCGARMPTDTDGINTWSWHVAPDNLPQDIEYLHIFTGEKMDSPNG